jgi:MucR family transcriptional regulator, transcriptional regulator of exopolysaccharide biosynthesis
MGTNQPDRGELAALTSRVVVAYVANASVPVSELATIIRLVHPALRGAGQAPVTEPKATKAPAVPIRRSVTPDHLVCLEDGVHVITLKRHLRTAHGLTPEEYRVRWGLTWDYPMAAPNYSEKRSAYARTIGLGRSRSEPASKPPKPLEPAPEPSEPALEPAPAAKPARQHRKRGKPAGQLGKLASNAASLHACP